MADGFIDVVETGIPTKSVDTTSLLVAAKTVQRERMVIAGAAATELADVQIADPTGLSIGLVVLPKVPSTGLPVAGTTPHDAAATTIDPLLQGGYASAGPPVPVGSDGDAVRAWFLRSGAQVVDIAAQSLPLAVAGESSDGVIQGGKPVSVGGLARNTDRPVVGNGDAVRLVADLLGKLVTLPYTISANIIRGLATLTLASDVSIIAAPGVGITNYITSVSGSNTNVTTDVRVDIKDGTTTILSFFCAAGGGGFSHQMPVPLALTANTALQMALSGAVTDVRVSAQGYKSAA